MKYALLLLLPGLLAGCSPERKSPDPAALRDQGDFKSAAAALDRALHMSNLSPEERKKLEFQRDLLDRIRKDYTLTREQLFHDLSDSVKDLTAKELDQWIAAGWFDKRTIDGTEYFFRASVANLYFRHPELEARRIDAPDKGPAQRMRLTVAREIKQAALAEKKPYVLPHHYKCTMTLGVDANIVPDGQMVRAWMPIPRKYPFQYDFQLLNSSPAIKVLAPETSVIRSTYQEQTAQKNQPMEFSITYTYILCGVHFELNAHDIKPADLSDPELKKFTQEAPHVVFSDKIKNLARSIIGGQTNPMLQAKALYDWVSANIQYSYAHEYSTLTNISDFCLTRGCGDCGEQALLFITLCRSQGIPARWQTGWDLFPHNNNIHDWSEIYLAPSGWIPVDQWAGSHAMHYCTKLTPQEQRELRDFYFGGLDYYRMIANSDHNQKLDPPKQSLRSDDVDFQRGELEWGNQNLYFGDYSYDWTMEEIN